MKYAGVLLVILGFASIGFAQDDGPKQKKKQHEGKRHAEEKKKSEDGNCACEREFKQAVKNLREAKEAGKVSSEETKRRYQELKEEFKRKCHHKKHDEGKKKGKHEGDHKKKDRQGDH
jgi:hypothetical protein